MILQKLASAIRRQDWFQVVIEVLIVIVGIFLGLQVSEWNEDRKNAIEASSYTSQLLTDTKLSLEIAIEHNEVFERRINLIDMHLRILKGEQPYDSNREDFERALREIRFMQPPEFGIGYVRDVINGNLPDIIVDKEIIRAAIELERINVRAVGRYNHMIGMLSTTNAAREKYQALGLTEDGHEPLYDLEQLKSTPEYIYAVQHALSLHKTAREENDDIIEYISILIEELKK